MYRANRDVSVCLARARKRKLPSIVRVLAGIRRREIGSERIVR